MKVTGVRRPRRVERVETQRRPGGRPSVGLRKNGSDAAVEPEMYVDCTIQDAHDLMVKFLPRLRRFARALTRDPDQSEDLTQETYARALQHLDQWQPGTRLDSWMFRIAQNLWIDSRRAEKLRGTVVDIAVIDEFSSCDGCAVAESRLALQDVRRSITQLSLDQRDLIRLVCVNGFSYEQAGKILNLPTGTVMSRLARARAALHECIQGPS